MNKRRLLSLILTAVLFLTLSGCAFGEGPYSSYRFPGEWEEHEGTWIIWPHDYGLIDPEYVDMIDEIWITMVQALHTAERVHIVAYDENEETGIRELLASEGVNLDQVDFLIAQTDQFWARDIGPLFVLDQSGAPAILDFGFNGYGRMDKLGPDVDEEYRWEMPEFVRGEYLENFVKDDMLNQEIARAMGIFAVDKNEFILEGGAVETDGCGTLITTESCILNENRNPGMTREEAEAYFEACFGVTNVIWLEGSPDEDITDGHIDGLMRFADKKTIVTMSEEDYFETYDYTPEGDYEIVMNATNADGEKYDIVLLPITREEVEWLGYRANYLNYYAGNAAVLVPVYGDIMDDEALRVLSEIYPDKEIVPVNGEILAAIGGGIHCVTQQQPLF